MSKSRLFAEWAILLIAAFALVVLANNRGWADRIDLNLLDFASSLKASEGNREIVIVEIDDQSLAQVGNWPWDRSRHAQLIEELSKLEPSVIAMDILFLEQSGEGADAALAKAIKEAGNVVLPHTFVERLDGDEGARPAFPLAVLGNAAASQGHVSIFPDQDGVVRRFAPKYQVGNGEFDHLVLAASNLAGHSKAAAELASETSQDNLPIIQYQLPGAYITIPASEVIKGAVPKEFLSDKIVLVGATAQGLGDRYAVPNYAGRIMSGVEVQANALDALIARNTLSSLSSGIVMAFHLVAIASLFLVYWLRPPAQGLRYSIILIVTLIIASIVSVLIFRILLPIAPALAAILIAYPLWGWRRLSTVSRFLDREVEALREAGIVDAVSAGRQGRETMDGASNGFDVVQRQVASLRGLTGEVRERLNFIQGVVDASPDPMMVFDGSGRLALYNAASRDVFMRGVDDRELTLNELVAGAGGEIDRLTQEVSLPPSKTFLFASAPLDEALGSEIVALRDITAIKQGEQQRRETLEFLSHDMRSPQVAIIGLAGSAGKGLEHEDRYGRIVEQARRTLKLAEDFVQIARLESEGISPEDSEIGALIYEAADRAYALAKRKNITIDCTVPEDPIFCEIDGSAISRVIDNLLSNALKFSPDASLVSLSLSEVVNDRLLLVLQDDGPGLPEERRADPFARFGSHDSRAGPSSGLGLAFVKRAVDEHGGQISFEAVNPQGTRVKISLPVSQG